MSRFLIALALAALIIIGAVQIAAAEEKDQPKARPAVPSEKVDASVDRSVTGIVEKIDAKYENIGTVVIKVGDDQPRYTLRITNKTKILRDTADPLEAGLKSPMLPGAAVRVVFVDMQLKGENGKPMDVRLCHTLLMMPPRK